MNPEIAAIKKEMSGDKTSEATTEPLAEIIYLLRKIESNTRKV